MGQVAAYKYRWRGFASGTVHLTWPSPCAFIHLHLVIEAVLVSTK